MLVFIIITITITFNGNGNAGGGVNHIKVNVLMSVGAGLYHTW